MEKTALFAKLASAAEENSDPARLYMGMVYLQNKNYESASHEFDVLKEHDYKDHWLEFALGQNALVDRNYSSAIIHLSNVVLINPLFFTAYPLLVEALSLSGEFVKRDKILNFINEKLPGFPTNLKMDMEGHFAELKNKDRPIAEVEKSQNLQSGGSELDEIIEEIEQGKYQKETPSADEKESEFASVMSDIFSPQSLDEEKTNSIASENIEKTEDISQQKKEANTLLNKDSSKTEVNLNKLKDEEIPQQPSQKPAKKRIVSKTLGEIYASQGQINEAISVFEKLLEQQPGNEEIIRKLSELKKL